MAQQVQVVSTPAADRLVAPASNAASQLAASLQQIEPEAHQLIMQVGGQLKDKAEAKAHADALKVHGQSLADAVRDGKIEPTQNPWYIQAFKRDAAMMGGHQQLTSLLADSQSWPEKADPAKYQARFEAEAGKIAEQYADKDAQQGYQAVAQPLMQQAFAQNTEYSVQQTVRAHTANVGSLLTTALRAAQKANGGTLLPAQAQEAIAPLAAQWEQTGGSKADFDQLVISSVTSAAEQAKSPSMMDLMKDLKSSSGGSLADLPGVAQDAQTAQYYIARSAEEEALGNVRMQDAQYRAEGYKVRDAVYKLSPNFLLEGGTPADIIDKLKGAGQQFTPQGLAEGLRLLDQDVSGSETLQRLVTARNTADPVKSKAIFGLWQESLDGDTPALRQKISKMFMANDIDLQTAQQMQAQASSKTNHDREMAHQDAAQSRAEKAAQDREHKLDPDYLDSDSKLVGAVERHVALSFVGIAAATNSEASDTTKKHMKDNAIARASGWLALHPKDYVGAEQQARDYLAAQMRTYIDRRKGAAKSGLQSAPGAAH